MTFRTALVFASASLLSVACDDAQDSARSAGERDASAARMAEPGGIEDLPVFENENWRGAEDDEIAQELLLDGREIEDVGFLAQMNPFGDPILYVYDAADFPSAGCAKGLGDRSIPEFAPGEATVNNPIEVPVLRLRYQSKTGDWTGEAVTLVDDGDTATFEDRVTGLVVVHEQEVPRAVGETLILDVTYTSLPVFDRAEPRSISEDRYRPLPHRFVGDALSSADAQDWRLPSPPTFTFADLSVDLDVNCTAGR